MSKKCTGGPAFPTLNAVMTGIDSDGVERWETEPNGGMTLRDYFAAKAMAALFARVDTGGFSRVSLLAYELADAMLEARK